MLMLGLNETICHLAMANSDFDCLFFYWLNMLVACFSVMFIMFSVCKYASFL